MPLLQRGSVSVTHCVPVLLHRSALRYNTTSAAGELGNVFYLRIRTGLTADDIINASAIPAELERLYRSDPVGFTSAFPVARASDPQSLILSFWHERLSAEAEGLASGTVERSDRRALGITVLLSLIAGTLIKLPEVTGLPSAWFLPRFAVPITLAAMIGYFLIRHPASTKVMFWIVTVLIVSFVYLGLLPDRPRSDTLTLAFLHVPLVLWTALGVAFCGDSWFSVRHRIDYLRYCGEVIIYASIVLVGGIVMTLLTFALFSLINVPIESWYTNYIVVYGLVSSPIVATFLYDRVQGRQTRLAAMLANVFAPLFLATVIAYLSAMLYMQRSPFSDRDFLISFNGLLLAVLAITVLSVTERKELKTAELTDYTNMALILVTLLIDGIALAAIAFRISTMGMSPNRLAVIGTNLLIFVHLARLFAAYMYALRSSHRTEAMDGLTARHLRYYSAWTAIVGFLFPIAFGFT